MPPINTDKLCGKSYETEISYVIADAARCLGHDGMQCTNNAMPTAMNTRTKHIASQTSGNKQKRRKTMGINIFGKKEATRTAREKLKQSARDSQQLATQQMTPSNQHQGQQPYQVPNDPTVYRSKSVATWSITCLLFMATVVCRSNTVIIAPVPNTKTNLKNKQSKNTATKQMTPLSRCRGSTQIVFRMQLLQ